MRPLAMMRAGVGRLRPAMAPAALIVCALLPAVSLALFRFAPQSVSSPAMLFLLVAFPLSSFLLVVFLWRARFHIHHLEAKQAEAIQNAGLDPLSEPAESPVLRQDPRERDRHFDARSICRSRSSRSTSTSSRASTTRTATAPATGSSCGIVERIRRVIREGDCLARVGGDEFALLLTDIGSPPPNAPPWRIACTTR